MTDASKQAALHFLRVIIAAMIAAGLDAALQWATANQAKLDPLAYILVIAVLSALGKALRDSGVLSWPTKML